MICDMNVQADYIWLRDRTSITRGCSKKEWGLEKIDSLRGGTENQNMILKMKNFQNYKNRCLIGSL